VKAGGNPSRRRCHYPVCGCYVSCAAEPDGLPRGSCSCGRPDVLLYKAASGLMGASNAADSDRLSYHDQPDGAACPNGGKPLSEVRS